LRLSFSFFHLEFLSECPKNKPDIGILVILSEARR